MITFVAETSFKDAEGIYKKFNIQLLKYLDEQMIVINLDGYDINSCGLNIDMLVDNEKLLFNHLHTMFGIEEIDNYKVVVIDINQAYKRQITYGIFHGAFIEMPDDEFHRQYNKFLEN